MGDASPGRKKNVPPPAASWEITYCALVLILVAFFAMLVSYSSIEDNKVSNFMRGFGGKTPAAFEPDLSSDETGYMPTAGERVHLPSKEITSLENETVMLAFEKLEKAAAILEAAGDAVSIEKTDRGFKAVMQGDVLFASGTADIDAALHPYLDELVQVLKEIDCMVRVEGHTDNVPIATARFPSNWELSTARAVNVIRYFLTRGKLPADRLEAVGFGEYRPLASNDTDEGRARNRRVECYFEPIRTSAGSSERGQG